MDAKALREILLATVSDDRSLEGFVQRIAAHLETTPLRVRDVLRDAKRLECSDRSSSGFVRELPIELDPASRSRSHDLVRVHGESPPGIQLPYVNSWAFVLAGSAREVNGRRWQPGDLLHFSRVRIHVEGPMSLVFIRSSDVLGALD